MKGKFKAEDGKPFVSVANSLFHDPNSRGVVRVMATRGGKSVKEKVVAFGWVTPEAIEDGNVVRDMLAIEITDKLNERIRYYKTMVLF